MMLSILLKKKKIAVVVVGSRYLAEIVMYTSV